jgi:hypothetical protein
MGGWFGDDEETYGRHSFAHARIPVIALLRRAVANGGAFRLAWRGDNPDVPVDRDDDFPTGVLPVVRDELADGAAPDEDTEPTTATRAARKWLQPPSFLCRRRMVVE